MRSLHKWVYSLRGNDLLMRAGMLTYVLTSVSHLSHVCLQLTPHCNASLQVPEFRVAYSINTDALDALYKRLKPKGVTMSGLLAKAAGVALSKHPVLYAGAPPRNLGCRFLYSVLYCFIATALQAQLVHMTTASLHDCTACMAHAATG